MDEKPTKGSLRISLACALAASGSLATEVWIKEVGVGMLVISTLLALWRFMEIGTETIARGEREREE